MNREDEAEFVISAPRRHGESMGYANHNGDFVDLTGAQTYGFEEATRRASEMAARLGVAVHVVPLLLGIPNVDEAIVFGPPQLT